MVSIYTDFPLSKSVVHPNQVPRGAFREHGFG